LVSLPRIFLTASHGVGRFLIYKISGMKKGRTDGPIMLFIDPWALLVIWYSGCPQVTTPIGEFLSADSLIINHHLVTNAPLPFCGVQAQIDISHAICPFFWALQRNLSYFLLFYFYFRLKQ